MIIIHAVQKLQNTSRLKAPLYVSEASPSQVLHRWYARLVSTSFPGKMLVMYMHEPSGLTILVHGKTIQSTHFFFKERLSKLLSRLGFTSSFIENEMSLQEEGYVVGKTNSKSMLARMNQINYQVEYQSSRAATYEEIPLGWMEEQIAEYPYHDPVTKKYRKLIDYFHDLGVIDEKPSH
jgi:hypothetical protein